MGERNIWKKHISFPQVQEHLYTRGEEEEEKEGGKASKKKLSQAGKQDIKSTFRSSIH